MGNVNLLFHTFWTACSPKPPGARWRLADAGTERSRGRGSAGDDPPAGAMAAGAPGPGARRQRDGAARFPRGRVPPNGGDRRGLGAGAGGAELARGGAGEEGGDARDTAAVTS